MKKIIALFFALTLIVSFAACTPNKPKDSSSSPVSSQAAGDGEAKLGLGVITSIRSSKDAGADNGLAQVDTNVAAVIVGADGKILNCYLDAIQTKVNFDKTGKIVTDLTVPVKTKTELGDAYGMKKASDIGKEWKEQAAALAEFVKGKTIAEVEGIAVDASGHPTGDDLKASVTVSISGYIAVIKKAYENAQAAGTKAGDKLGLGVYTELKNSKDAGDAPGQAQAYSTYAAVSFGDDGKITGCVIDASQSNVPFDKTGKLTVNAAEATFQTKNELGEGYGMKKNSDIGKEWNEQAKAFAEYVKGKTADEVKGIAVDAETHPTGADLKSSVTITVGGFQTVIQKAFDNKK